MASGLVLPRPVGFVLGSGGSLGAPGPAIHRVSPLEFDHTAMLIESGYQAARPFLDSLDIAGPGLYGPVSRC